MKKGFTLVELLSVIVILSTVSMIVFPAIISILKDSKDKAYEVQIKDIEMSADKWSLENLQLLDKYHLNSTYLELGTLQKEGFLDLDKIENPKTGEDMNGCVEIKYNESTSQYNSKYYDVTCTALVNNSDLIQEPHGYIRKYVDEKLVVEDVNPIVSAGIAIENKYQGLISFETGTTDGLYDIGDEYVFRGNDPKNYAKIDGTNDLWRIISINKKTYIVKLVKASLLASNQWDAENKNDFLISSINAEILNEYKKEDTIQAIKDKIENATWNVGVVSDINVNVNILKSIEASNTIVNEMGLLNISDYALASLDYECFQNVNSDSCVNNNYLYNQFSGTTWTINTNGSQIWSISSGKPLLVSATGLYNIYPVIQIKPSAYVTNINDESVGTNTNPYILK